MLRPLALFSGSVPSPHIRSSAGFTITTCVFEFSVHTGIGSGIGDLRGGIRYFICDGNEAINVGARVGNDALERIATQAKNRPMATLAIAIGVGLLIGFAVRRS